MMTKTLTSNAPVNLQEFRGQLVYTLCLARLATYQLLLPSCTT